MADGGLRNTVLNMLLKTLENKELSHYVLNDILENSSLESRDRAFINRLYSGTIEKLVYEDYVIGHYSSTPVRKMKPAIRNILRMGVYQLKFMDSVPSHAAIDESVKLTRKRGFNNLSGFVNAILRKIDKEADSLELPANVRAFAPAWIFDLITEQYGPETAGRFFEAVQEKDEGTWVRFNLLHSDKESVIELLEADGCTVVPADYPEGAYLISGFDSLTELRAYKKGLIIIQDPSSMIAAQTACKGLAGPKLIVDVCAAPGGKSMYIAERFPDARIISRDLTDKKVRLIKENISRLGIGNIEPQVYDALQPDETLISNADLVVADLPCSGLGVIKRKPDIMYRLQEGDLAELAELQRQILSVVQAYVKPGGVLLFSTCTINKGENEVNKKWFLENFDFRLDSETQFVPGTDEYDGFYIARFINNE